MIHNPSLSWGSNVDSIHFPGLIYGKPPNSHFIIGSGEPFSSGYPLPSIGKNFLEPNSPENTGCNILYNYHLQHLKFTFDIFQSKQSYSSGLYKNPQNLSGISPQFPTPFVNEWMPNLNIDEKFYFEDQWYTSINNDNLIYTFFDRYRFPNTRSGVYYGKYCLQYHSSGLYDIYDHKLSNSGIPVLIYKRQYKPNNEHIDLELYLHYYAHSLSINSTPTIQPLRFSCYSSGNIVLECTYRDYFQSYFKKNPNIQSLNQTPLQLTKQSFPGYFGWRLQGSMKQTLLKLSDHNKVIRLNNLKYLDSNFTTVEDSKNEYNNYNNFTTTDIPELTIPILINPTGYSLNRYSLSDKIYDNYIFENLTFIGESSEETYEIFPSNYYQGIHTVTANGVSDSCTDYETICKNQRWELIWNNIDNSVTRAYSWRANFIYNGKHDFTLDQPSSYIQLGYSIPIGKFWENYNRDKMNTHSNLLIFPSANFFVYIDDIPEEYETNYAYKITTPRVYENLNWNIENVIYYQYDIGTWAMILANPPDLNSYKLSRQRSTRTFQTINSYGFCELFGFPVCTYDIEYVDWPSTTHEYFPDNEGDRYAGIYAGNVSIHVTQT